jgi:hypothetical protein
MNMLLMIILNGFYVVMENALELSKMDAALCVGKPSKKVD